MVKVAGNRKRKTFNPTKYQKKVLLDGAKMGELMAKNLVFRERLDGVMRQNNWRYVLGGPWGDGIKATQRMKNYDIFDPRARYTYEAISTSPAMTIPRPGVAQLYLGKFDDDKGMILKGSENYVMKVSKAPPAKLFWSFTVYDTNTRALLDNRKVSPVGGDVTVDSVDKGVKVNPDGSIYIMFGPDKPKKEYESNYIQTIPGKGWFVYLRAYGAEPEIYTKKYKLPSLDKVKDHKTIIEKLKKL